MTIAPSDDRSELALADLIASGAFDRHVRAARDEHAPGSGELWGIYAHPDAWSTGVGHALITAVEQALRSDGHETAYLWVLEGNERAARFYERHGWASDGARKVDTRPGLVLHERRHVKLLD